MKDYKRLTDEYYFDCNKCVDGECSIPDIFCQYRYRCEIYNRLHSLEDKIKRGEIDYVADKDKEIARLTAENAELKATLSKMEKVEKELRNRLENAVEIPISDRVWCITADEDGKESYIVSKPTDFLTIDELKYEMGKKYFTTRKSAEAFLRN